VLLGIKPVILAVVFQALWRLGKSALKSRVLAVLGAVAAAANLLGAHELGVLFAAGLVASTLLRPPGSSLSGPSAPTRTTWPLPWPSLAVAGAVAPVAATASLSSIFGFFLKVGSVLFGSGYVLLAFLRADLVERWGWLNEAQLLDAIAIGQFTPGPVFTTATFIGYLLGDWPGAVAATVGIFLPAFVFVGMSGSIIPRLRRSPIAGAFLDGLNAASLALMFVVTLRLAQGAILNLPGFLIALTSGALLFRTRVNSAWLVLGGALIGSILHRYVS
jgi:chromate transporter